MKAKPEGRSVSVVAMDEQEQTRLVHVVRLREGEGLPNEPSQPLTERVVPAFDVSGPAALFPTGGVLFFRDDFRIGFPEVSETVAVSIRRGDRLPQLPAGLRASISQRDRHNLTRCSAHRHPDPDFVHALEDKTPQFIQLQYLQLWMVGIGTNEGLFEGRER